MSTSNPLQPSLLKNQLVQPLLNPQLSPSNHFEKRSRCVQYLVPAPGSTSWWPTSCSTFCCFLAFSSPRLRQCLSEGHIPQQHIIENVPHHKSLNNEHWTSFEHQQHHIIELHVINSTYLNIFWKSKAPHPSAYPASFISYTSCSICSTFYIDTFSPLFKFALYWSCLGSLLLLTKGTINFCGRWTNSLHRRSYSAIHFVKGW